MSVELVAILGLYALGLASSVFALVYAKRSKEEFREEVHEIAQTVYDGVGEILTDPTVKKAFSILGGKGGEARADNMLVDEMATDMLDTPQFEAIKMGASAIGFDLESYIEKHGAVKTLKAANQLASSLGIDLMNLDIGALLGGITKGGAPTGDNPYLRR